MEKTKLKVVSSSGTIKESVNSVTDGMVGTCTEKENAGDGDSEEIESGVWISRELTRLVSVEF